MASLIGMIAAFVLIISAYVIEGGIFLKLLSISSFMIVVGGTVGAIVISFPINEVKKVPAMLKIAFKDKKSDLPKLIYYFKDVSTKTRRNGLLSLESEISAQEDLDPFIKKGLQMVVDGIEPQSVRSTLELQAEMMSQRHKDRYSIFEAAGGYSPTMGIIGTVTGLVNVLGSLGSDPNGLGEKIATAFIATLYGIGFANLIWLPIGNKLKAVNNIEMKEKELIIEAISLIQEGVNPNVISEKLKSFLGTEELEKYQQLDKAVEV